MEMFFKTLNRKVRVNLILQSVGMLMGTSTHIAWIFQNGFLSENYNASLFSKIFWDSLTFLDPLAALLLFIKPKSGVFLTLIIILVDVIHNNVVYCDELYINAPQMTEWLVKYWMILGQIVFGLFVVVSLKSNLKEINRNILK